MRLHETRILRRIFLPLFARFNPGNITIRHHYTGDRIRLHCYRHKGYWYHRRRREAQTMRLFQELIPEGATVLDVGGHIGYVALYLASLVGPRGRVYTFEPGENNLPYLRRNTESQENITVVERGAGACNERRSFYLEDLTGQNNSFVKDFDVLEFNKAQAHALATRVEEVTVEVVTLDDFCRTESICPDFIKIDVEGFELEVLKGASALLREARPMLMVEIQTNREPILQMMKEQGYCMFTPAGDVIRHHQDLASRHMNTFCLHQQAHAEFLSRLCRAAA